MQHQTDQSELITRGYIDQLYVLADKLTEQGQYVATISESAGILDMAIEQNGLTVFERHYSISKDTHAIKMLQSVFFDYGVLTPVVPVAQGCAPLMEVVA